MRKEWKSPELVVLMRSRPEERVLQACKSDVTLTGANNYNSACWQQAACNSYCVDYSVT